MHTPDTRNVPSFEILKSTYLESKSSFDLIPLGQGITAKKPIVKQWHVRNFTSYDFDMHIRRGFNVGVRLKTNQLVVDVDPRNFKGGIDSLQKLSTDIGFDFFSVPYVTTGGGWHFYFRKAPNVEIRRELKEDYPGIEFKSKGQYVVAAGCIHTSTKKMYSLGNNGLSLSQVRNAPKGLMALLEIKPKPPGIPFEDPIANSKLAELFSVLDAAEHKDSWQEYLMAAHEATNGEGIEEFIDWSVSDPAYTGHDEIIRKRWESLNGDRAIMITRATLYNAVIKAGHVNLLPLPTAQDDFADDPITDEDLARYRVIEMGNGLSGFLNVDQILAIKPPEWQIEGMIPKGGIGLLYGASGTNKTFIALDLAARSSVGLKAYFGKETKKADVFYIAAEGASGFSLRLAAWIKHHEVRPESLFLRPYPANLEAEQAAKAIADDMILMTPNSENRFIIVDTLSANFRGSENTDEVASLLAQCSMIAARAKATFLILHHTGKDDGREERGHYSLRANVDFSIKVRKDHQDNSVRVSVEKLKDAAQGEAFKLQTKWVETKPGAEFNGSLVMVEYSEFSSEGDENELIWAAAIEIKDGASQKALAELLSKKHGWPNNRTLDRKIAKAMPESGKPTAAMGYLFSRIRAGSSSKSPKVIQVKKDI